MEDAWLTTSSAVTSSPQQQRTGLHWRWTEDRPCRRHLDLERAHVFKIAAVQSIASWQRSSDWFRMVPVEGGVNKSQGCYSEQQELPWWMIATLFNFAVSFVCWNAAVPFVLSSKLSWWKLKQTWWHHHSVLFFFFGPELLFLQSTQRKEGKKWREVGTKIKGGEEILQENKNEVLQPLKQNDCSS